MGWRGASCCRCHAQAAHPTVTHQLVAIPVSSLGQWRVAPLPSMQQPWSTAAVKRPHFRTADRLLRPHERGCGARIGRGTRLPDEEGLSQMPQMTKAATTGLSALLRLGVIAGAALLLPACANKQMQPDSAQLGPGGGAGGPITPGTQRDFATNVGDIVYFSTDSVDLTPEAEQTLQKQAQWLRQYPQFTITVEGHADERGTREYNIALGARRATTVRNYLARSGINASRMRTISYGKERPVAVCDDISCWSQNRRAQTVLNARVGSR